MNQEAKSKERPPNQNLAQIEKTFLAFQYLTKHTPPMLARTERIQTQLDRLIRRLIMPVLIRDTAEYLYLTILER